MLRAPNKFIIMSLILSPQQHSPDPWLWHSVAGIRKFSLSNLAMMSWALAEVYWHPVKEITDAMSERYHRPLSLPEEG